MATCSMCGMETDSDELCVDDVEELVCRDCMIWNIQRAEAHKNMVLSPHADEYIPPAEASVWNSGADTASYDTDSGSSCEDREDSWDNDEDKEW